MTKSKKQILDELEEEIKYLDKLREVVGSRCVERLKRIVIELADENL